MSIYDYIRYWEYLDALKYKGVDMELKRNINKEILNKKWGIIYGTRNNKERKTHG